MLGHSLLFLFNNYALDTDRRELRSRGALINVEPQVFDLLTYLIEQRDKVVSKDDLIASVWKGRIVSDSTLDSRVNAARKAVGDSGEKQDNPHHRPQRIAVCRQRPPGRRAARSRLDASGDRRETDDFVLSQQG